MAGATRLELATSGSTVRCTNQLCYTPKGHPDIDETVSGILQYRRTGWNLSYPGMPMQALFSKKLTAAEFTRKLNFRLPDMGGNRFGTFRRISDMVEMGRFQSGKQESRK